MASFISVEHMKTYPLPVTDKQWTLVGDEQIAYVSAYASQHLEDYMDRKVEITSYTERHKKGTGTHRMLLGLYPVTELTSVSAYDGMGNQTDYDVDELYTDADAGIIEFIKRDKYAFTKASTWVIEYSAGYSEIPGPILHATALQTVKMLQPLFRGGSTFTETEFITDLDEQIVELLEYYKRRRIG